MGKKGFTRGEMKDKIEKLQLKNVRLRQEIIHNDNAISEAHKVNDELKESLEKAVELLKKARTEIFERGINQLEESGANPREAEIMMTKCGAVYDIDAFLTSHE